MEPVGCINSLPLYNWNSIRGDRGSGAAYQPHHHQGHAGFADCQGSQITEDGQGNPISAGHCYASFAPGNAQC